MFHTSGTGGPEQQTAGRKLKDAIAPNIARMKKAFCFCVRNTKVSVYTALKIADVHDQFVKEPKNIVDTSVIILKLLNTSSPTVTSCSVTPESYIMRSNII
jgi:hypothetical protein